MFSSANNPVRTLWLTVKCPNHSINSEIHFTVNCPNYSIHFLTRSMSNETLLLCFREGAETGESEAGLVVGPRHRGLRLRRCTHHHLHRLRRRHNDSEKEEKGENVSVTCLF